MNVDKKPVDDVLSSTLTNLKEMIDVNSIVGDPIKTDNATIIPISRVSVGFVSGGGEYESQKKKNFVYPFAGGSGGGCNITPIGFIIANPLKVEFIKIDGETSIDKVLDLVQNVVKGGGK